MLGFYLTLIDDDSERSLFEKIYYSYRKQMVLLALSYVKNNSDAEDIVHDVFLSVAKKHIKIISEMKSNTNIKNYLLKATKNMALNHLKKKSNNVLSLDGLELCSKDSLSEQSDDNFIDRVCTNFDYEEVLNVLQSLNDTYCDALYYHFVAELSISEVAKILNQSISTTKKQLVRGKKLLISKLEKEVMTADVNQ